ncbi:KxYKxGKxW signal peptide domain-containing protein, partial [Lactiplantibacillus plantarum]
MTKKNNRNKLLLANKNERIKMYKKGRTWMFAGITTFSGMLGGIIAAPSAKADNTTGQQVTTTKEINNSSDILATKSLVTIPASSDLESTSMSTSMSTSTSTSMSTSMSTSTS